MDNKQIEELSKEIAFICNIPVFAANEVETQISSLITAAIDGQWVKVEDRLPEVGRYFVYRSNTTFGTSYFDGNKWEKYPFGISITHWQPLPPPPKQ